MGLKLESEVREEMRYNMEKLAEKDQIYPGSHGKIFFSTFKGNALQCFMKTVTDPVYIFKSLFLFLWLMNLGPWRKRKETS